MDIAKVNELSFDSIVKMKVTDVILSIPSIQIIKKQYGLNTAQKAKSISELLDLSNEDIKQTITDIYPAQFIKIKIKQKVKTGKLKIKMKRLARYWKFSILCGRKKDRRRRVPQRVCLQCDQGNSGNIFSNCEMRLLYHNSKHDFNVWKHNNVAVFVSKDTARVAHLNSERSMRMFKNYINNWINKRNATMKKEMELTEQYYNSLCAADKLEYWEEYLGKEKLDSTIVELIFNNPDEMYNDEIVISELEKMYGLSEMIEAVK